MMPPDPPIGDLYGATTTLLVGPHAMAIHPHLFKTRLPYLSEWCAMDGEWLKHKELRFDFDTLPTFPPYANQKGQTLDAGDIVALIDWVYRDDVSVLLARHPYETWRSVAQFMVSEPLNKALRYARWTTYLHDGATAGVAVGGHAVAAGGRGVAALYTYGQALWVQANIAQHPLRVVLQGITFAMGGAGAAFWWMSSQWLRMVTLLLLIQLPFLLTSDDGILALVRKVVQIHHDDTIALMDAAKERNLVVLYSALGYNTLAEASTSLVSTLDTLLIPFKVPIIVATWITMFLFAGISALLPSALNHFEHFLRLFHPVFRLAVAADSVASLHYLLGFAALNQTFAEAFQNTLDILVKSA